MSRPLPSARRNPWRGQSVPAFTGSVLAGAAVALSVLVLAGCGSGAATDQAGGVRIVAAENFWGSIATQIVGSKGSVDSIITNPAQDPHSYQPSTEDARTLATAQLVIVDGVGYDPWASQLLAANPTPGRIALNVGDQFGLTEGDNPHRWYDPADVEATAAVITKDLTKLDPRDTQYFKTRLHEFDASGLATYHRLIQEINHRFHGAPVGASESIFALQAPALGLDLKTPYSFMKAISEGTEVTAHDTLITQQQIQQHQIKVWIYNAQNATPQIQQLNALARAAHIPTVTITETLSPAGDSFEQWQVAQLRRLQHALAEADPR